MKITSTGQMTIPRHVLDQLDWVPGTTVEWEVRDGAALLRRSAAGKLDGRALVERMRGRGTVNVATGEIMALTRGE